MIPLHGRAFLNRSANKNNGSAKKMQGKANTKRIKVNDENAARQVGLRKSATKDHKKRLSNLFDICVMALIMPYLCISFE